MKSVLTNLALNKKTKELWVSPVDQIGTRNRLSVKNLHTGKWYQYAVSSLKFLDTVEARIVFQAKKILRGKKKHSEVDCEILQAYSNIIAD